MTPSDGRKVVWVLVSPDERATLKRLADREKVSVPQFIRDCINDRLVEEDEVALIRLRDGRGRWKRVKPFMG